MDPSDDILGALLSMLTPGELAPEPAALRRRITTLLTLRPARDLPEEAWPLLSELWERETANKAVTRAADLPRITANGRWTDRISLWRGDITTGELTDRSAVPRCPRCRGDMMLNVRGGSWFVSKPYESQGRRFNEWLNAALRGRFLIIEIGAGYSTPSVIRWPCEALAANSPNAHLIRINLHHPEVHDSLHGRSTCIAARGATLLSVLLPELQDPS